MGRLPAVRAGGRAVVAVEGHESLQRVGVGRDVGVRADLCAQGVHQVVSRVDREDFPTPMACR